jgi:hypothetical protein
MRPRFCLIGLLLPFSACAPFLPQQEASYSGTFARVCSPVDAVGYQFDLKRDDGAGPAWLSLALWQPGLLESGGSLRLSGGFNDGSLAACDEKRNCVPLGPATLRLEPANPAAAIRGEVQWTSAGLRQHAFFSAGRNPADPAPICG